MKITEIMDMHSGGGLKTEFNKHLFLDMGENEAINLFERMTNRSVDHVTCQCCGGDFSVQEWDATELLPYILGDKWTFNQYSPLANKVRVITRKEANEIREALDVRA